MRCLWKIIRLKARPWPEVHNFRDAAGQDGIEVRGKIMGPLSRRVLYEARAASGIIVALTTVSMWIVICDATCDGKSALPAGEAVVNALALSAIFSFGLVHGMLELARVLAWRRVRFLVSPSSLVLTRRAGRRKAWRIGHATCVRLQSHGKTAVERGALFKAMDDMAERGEVGTHALFYQDAYVLEILQADGPQLVLAITGRRRAKALAGALNAAIRDVRPTKEEAPPQPIGAHPARIEAGIV